VVLMWFMVVSMGFIVVLIGFTDSCFHWIHSGFMGFIAV
jgi:hypothetical protein